MFVDLVPVTLKEVPVQLSIKPETGKNDTTPWVFFIRKISV
jgi:hypothetical protein